MAKIALDGAYVDLRISVAEIYAKVSEKGNQVVAPETAKVEVIGFSDHFANASASHGRYGQDRGKLTCYVQVAAPKVAAKRGKVKAKAEAAPAETPAVDPALLAAILAALGKK